MWKFDLFDVDDLKHLLRLIGVPQFLCFVFYDKGVPGNCAPVLVFCQIPLSVRPDSMWIDNKSILVCWADQMADDIVYTYDT